jgi:hypothetical protein
LQNTTNNKSLVVNTRKDDRDLRAQDSNHPTFTLRILETRETDVDSMRSPIQLLAELFNITNMTMSFLTTDDLKTSREGEE